MTTMTPWRTFSIFISSTFADMQAERDHLKNIVFPRVEEELRKKRIRLETVDLRWGVDTTTVNEDEREATILKVCLEEIERCKPFFIGLLGDRYGWVPPEERIVNATVGRKLLFPNKGKSVTALEIELGVLAGTEQLNRSVFYLREPLPYDKLSPEKAAKFSDQYDPLLSEEEKRKRKESLDKLKEEIKSHFKKINLPEKLKTYPAELNTQSVPVIRGLEPWDETVIKDIIAECEKHAEDTWGEVPKDKHEQEVALLEAFIEEHTHISTTITEKGEEQVHTFCGRKKLIEELRDHLLSDSKEKWGIVLTGESGSGKSAVFSMMYKTMIREDCLVLTHSAGISPTAKSEAELLKKWNRHLREFLGIEEKEQEEEQGIRELERQSLSEGDIREASPKTGIEKLQEQFSGLLYQAVGKKRVVLLIDAIDRFEPTSKAQYMTWLPETIPANIRVLITAITGTEKNAVQYHKGLVTRSIDQFTQEEAREMLYSLGRRQHKSLPKAVEKKILEKERGDSLLACSSPLWLSLAVNILMAMDADDFDRMSKLEGKGGEQIDSYMSEMARQFPPLPGDLFLDLIKRAGRIFGESFTISLFNFIACSRAGLRESDLEKLIPEQTLQLWSPLTFASLRRWFRAHLVEQGVGHQWNLAHSILRNTLKEKIELNNLKNLHTLISSYLLSLPSTDTLRITETMYHLLQMDDKIPAIEYYTSDLDNESLAGATNILSETVTSSEEGLATIASMPSLIEDRKDILPVLLRRFISELDDNLALEGNLERRLETLNNFNELIEKCFDSSIPTWDFGHNRAVLFERLGSIHKAMGHMEEALKYFEKYNKLTKELYESNPGNEALKNGLAISYDRLGAIHEAEGKLEEALLNYEKGKNLMQDLLEDNPKSEKIKNDFAISYGKLGNIHQAIGHMEEALKYFEKDLELTKELYESNPRNESLKNGLAISYQNLGLIHQAIGHMEEALKYFEKDLELKKELYESNPRNESLKNGLAISYSNLGDIHQAMGHMEEALKYFEKRSALGKELYDSNPRNESLKNGLAISYSKLGDIHQAMGHMEEALKYFEKRSALGKELYDSNPRNESLKNGLAISHERLGDIHKAMGHMEEALKYFELKFELNSELYKNNPSNEKNKNDLAIANERLGNIHQAMGHMEEALKYFDEEVRLFKELYESNPRHESLKNGLAISYTKLGDIHKAMGHMEEALKYFELKFELNSELYKNNPSNEKNKHELAIANERLGDIHQAMGHMEKALKYFEKDLELTKELYESNPSNELLKNGLAISYEELGDIHQSMGRMVEAQKYFEKDLELTKELYESNPRNVNLLEGLGISYYKLAMVYKAMGNDEKGKEYFSQWKNIISFLAENLQKVQKYRQWNEVEY